MKITDRLKLAYKSFTTAVDPSSGYSRSADWFFADWPAQNCIVPNPTGCMPKSSLVAAACNWLGTVLSGSPVEVYKREGDEWQIVRDHPMSLLIAEPNPYHSGALFWKSFAYYWFTNGNVYFFKARNGGNKVVELWLLQSDRVTVHSENGEFISYYEYSPPSSGTLQRIEPEDIIHFRYGLDPEDHRLGISPLVSLQAEISTDVYGEAYSRTALGNAGVPPYVVSPKLQGDNYIKFDADQMKASIEAATGGFNKGKPLVISKPTDIKEFGFSPQQMDTRSLRRVPEERVSAVLGIPAIVLGFGVGLEHATYANYRTALRAAWDNCVIPTQMQIADVLWANLLPDFIASTNGYWVEFDNSEVDALKENVNDLYSREISAWVNGVKKLSEVRTALDLEVTPDEEIYLIGPGDRQVRQPGGMGESIGSTMRQPKLTPPLPEKALDMADFEMARIWWREMTGDSEAGDLFDATEAA